MLTFHDSLAGTVPAPGMDLATAALPDGVLWIDLLHETEDEVAFVERVTGLQLPDAHRRAEVETSSRLALEHEVMLMSTPVLYRDESNVFTTPVGFVLSKSVLVTLRVEKLRAFADFIARREAPDCRHPRTSTDVLLGLLDAILDRMADGMEAVGRDLEVVSKGIFGIRAGDGIGSKPTKIEAKLQETLRIVGQSGDTTGHVRDSLLGLRRLLAFVAANLDPAHESPEAKRALDALRADVDSLNEYETHLTDKVQFLLDSTLGFINIEQNRTFKLLTVASVIGIPPTFVVGLYGMNFKGMPEYDWTYGYAWGLFLVLVSIVVPVVWLRRRGWF